MPPGSIHKTTSGKIGRAETLFCGREVGYDYFQTTAREPSRQRQGYEHSLIYEVLTDGTRLRR